MALDYNRKQSTVNGGHCHQDNIYGLLTKHRIVTNFFLCMFMKGGAVASQLVHLFTDDAVQV